MVQGEGKWTEGLQIHLDGWLPRTAKSDERANIFVCCLSYGFRMKTSAGSLNRELNLRTCSSVSFRCPARNIESALSDPNSGVKSRCVRPCCSMSNRTTEAASAAGIV